MGRATVEGRVSALSLVNDNDWRRQLPFPLLGPLSQEKCGETLVVVGRGHPRAASGTGICERRVARAGGLPLLS